MNLIEQLGGYEKAKGCLEKYPFKIYSCKDTLDKISLSNALLQYRRENNIFEVGDYIVDTVSNQFFKIIKVDGCDLLVEQRFWVNSLYQRHATDKEIAQGYRDEAK